MRRKKYTDLIDLQNENETSIKRHRECSVPDTLKTFKTKMKRVSNVISPSAKTWILDSKYSLKGNKKEPCQHVSLSLEIAKRYDGHSRFIAFSLFFFKISKTCQ